MKRKKYILILVLLVGITATFAYYNTTQTFTNLFQPGVYANQVTEIFDSPDDWKPGDETEKKLTVKNTGTICEKVRISYTEKWTSKNGDDLELTFCKDEENKNDDEIPKEDVYSELSFLNENYIVSKLGYMNQTGLIKKINKTDGECPSPESIAVINFDNQEDWVYHSGYYYYHKDLLANETTSSFIKSVTFNPNYAKAIECEETTTNTYECSPTGSDHVGGSYQLTFHVETIQCGAEKDVWNLGYGLVEFVSDLDIPKENLTSIEIINPETGKTITTIAGVEQFEFAETSISQKDSYIGILSSVNPIRKHDVGDVLTLQVNYSNQVPRLYKAENTWYEKDETIKDTYIPNSSHLSNKMKQSLLSVEELWMYDIVEEIVEKPLEQ